jgi:hypothetical protein
MRQRTAALWIVWLLFTAVTGVALALQLTQGENRSLFLIGETTSGHYQIEMACEACHSEPFGGREVLQEACRNCHAEELELADDSHPKSKFTDPRNADRVAILDARYCVTCHREHRPKLTEAMGVTLPEDYCFYCHRDIGEERPSHAGLGFDTCASAGCHNFHDNRALYEDFLISHAHQAALVAPSKVPALSGYAMIDRAEADPLSAADIQAPEEARPSDVVMAWEHSAHARAGVGCQDCHQPRPGQDWDARPETTVCADCHQPQFETWQSGKHGMRTAQDLTPMRPAWARLPMRPEAFDEDLSCASCHGPHAVDTRRAAIEGCLNCHADDHSLAFEDSPHFRLWQLETEGSADPRTGVSCATCHLPREQSASHGHAVVIANHNQNANLRPNEKMLRSVCMSCHGLGFAMDALADEELIRRNFKGQPTKQLTSIEMALQRQSD